MKNSKCLALMLVCLLAMTLSLSIPVSALTRTATISSSSKTATIGETVTVTLGFSPSSETRGFGFILSYDGGLLEYISGRDLSGISGGAFHAYAGGSQINTGVTVSGTQSVVTSRAVSLTFKAKAAGKVTIKIIDANDGIIDPEENIIKAGASVSITITDDQATTTTTTATTTPTTTTTTTTPTTPRMTTRTTRTTTTTPRTTTPKTTTSRTTTSGTTTSKTTTELTTTTSETSPEVTKPIVAFSAKRYDGVNLSIPESVPSEENIPASFSPVEIDDYGNAMTVYRSSTLPYTLFWLADEGGEARFYYCDEETSLYVPYFRTEWSSRYFTFTVLPEERLPQGFELTTREIRGNKVPVYIPSKGFFMTLQSYFDLMSKVDPDTTVPDWRHYEGESSRPISGDSTDPSDSTGATTGRLFARISTTLTGGNDPLTWLGVPVEIPDDILLVALRMSDSEKKMLYFYDQTIDSLIRAELWLVPLAGTFLDHNTSTEPDVQPTTIVTEPPTTPSQRKPIVSEANTIRLFGLTMPIWLPIVGGTLLIILLLLLIRGVIRALKTSKPSHDFHLDDESFDDDFEHRDTTDWTLLDDVPEDDNLAWKKESWKRLGVVDMIDRSADNDETNDAMRTRGSFNGDELDETSLYDREAVMTSGVEKASVHYLEGEWADLQKAVEISSARRLGRETVSDFARDEDDYKSKDNVEDVVEPDSVVETNGIIIQPGMGTSRPRRRIPLKRLQGIKDAEKNDYPPDGDEL